MNSVKVKKVDYYVTKNGRAPFLEWINGLGIKKQIIVDRYIQRMAQGGAGWRRVALKNPLRV